MRCVFGEESFSTSVSVIFARVYAPRVENKKMLNECIFYVERYLAEEEKAEKSECTADCYGSR